MKKKLFVVGLLILSTLGGAKAASADGRQYLVTGWRSEAHTYLCTHRHQTVIKRGSHKSWAGWSSYGYSDHSTAICFGGSGATVGGHSHTRLK